MCLAIPGKIVELLRRTCHKLGAGRCGRRAAQGRPRPAAGRHARARRLGADPRRLRHEQDQRARCRRADAHCSRMLGEDRRAMEEVRGYGLERGETRPMNAIAPN